MFPDLMTDDAFRLETGRLWLRWPRLADGVAIAKYAGEQAVSRYTDRIPHPYQPSDAEAFVLGCRQENAAGRQCTLALTGKGKPDGVIGMIGVHPRATGKAALGFWLGEPFWGKGLMGEALDEVLALAFTATPVRTLLAIVRQENKASQDLLVSRRFEHVEDRMVSIPLRGGIFPCGKYRLEQKHWRECEAERFRRNIRARGSGALMRARAGTGETKLSA